jgi:WD40 repeat protein
LILYKKNNLNELYNEIKNIKINEEIKNINYINENIFCNIQPENESVTFYDVEDLNDNNLVIKNIQTEFGRYNVKNVEKYNCVFIAGLFGIYTISTVKYAIISFFLLNERISCIDYDFINNYLICGSIKKNSNNKNYNLILFNIKQEKSENNTFDEINIFEKERINNVHHDDIIVIQNSRDGFILTGSNDKTIKIWKEIIGK